RSASRASITEPNSPLTATAPATGPTGTFARRCSAASSAPSPAAASTSSMKTTGLPRAAGDPEAARRRPHLHPRTAILHPISGDGVNFGLPEMIGGQILSIVPWSRLLDDQEALLAINTDLSSTKTAWVTIEASLHKPGEKLNCVYSTDGAQIGKEASIEARNGLSVSLTVPGGGFVIFR